MAKKEKKSFGDRALKVKRILKKGKRMSIEIPMDEIKMDTRQRFFTGRRLGEAKEQFFFK